MISDQDALRDIRSSWNGVDKLARHPKNYSIPGSVTWIVPAGPPELPNLPLLLAYSVLDNVLSQLVGQGVFTCRSWMLGRKMEASRLALPWQDYQKVDAGRELRNRLAHEATYLSPEDCQLYIQAVKIELTAWHIL